MLVCTREVVYMCYDCASVCIFMFCILFLYVPSFVFTPVYVALAYVLHQGTPLHPPIPFD